MRVNDAAKIKVTYIIELLTSNTRRSLNLANYWLSIAGIVFYRSAINHQVIGSTLIHFERHRLFSSVCLFYVFFFVSTVSIKRVDFITGRPIDNNSSRDCTSNHFATQCVPCVGSPLKKIKGFLRHEKGIWRVILINILFD